MSLYLDGKLTPIDHLGNVVIMNSLSRMGGISHEWNRNLKKKKYEGKFKERDEQDEILELLSLEDFTHLAWVTIKL